MKEWYIIQWDRGVKNSLIVPAVDLEGVFFYLQKTFPATEIRLQGHNFHYTPNGAHYHAAGYPMETFVAGYDTLKGPAHFNPSFFDVLGWKEKFT